MKKMIRFSAVSTACMVVGAANAFDLGADYSFHLNQSVNYDTDIGAWTGNHDSNTAIIRGNRSAGAAGGTTTLMPFATNVFDTYCSEIGQTIGGGYVTHSSVTPLLGSVTNTGGSSGPVTFDATRTSRLELLWGNFKSLATDADHSAAFQLAQWELCFDTDATLDAGAGAKFWSTSGAANRTIAEGWLTDIRNGSVTTHQSLLLLSDSGTQDLITPVPEPMTILALGGGVAMVIRRRRNRKS